MTEDGMCGVFIADRVLAGWWRSEWKVSDHYLNRDGGFNLSRSCKPPLHTLNKKIQPPSTLQ